MQCSEWERAWATNDVPRSPGLCSGDLAVLTTLLLRTHAQLDTRKEAGPLSGSLAWTKKPSRRRMNV